MSLQRPLVLLTNDDGYRAAGIRFLRQSLEKWADVVVVAPDGERSGVSHGISLNRALRVNQLEDDVYVVDGTPVDCVYLALYKLLDRRPDVVVSGINHGANLGSDVYYSGTVAAAREGALRGVCGIAFSQDMGSSSLDDELAFGRSAACGAAMVAKVLKESRGSSLLLNVNFPDCGRWREVRGVKICELGESVWENSVSVRVDPRGKPYYWIGGERQVSDRNPSADDLALDSGYVAISPLACDPTHHPLLDKVAGMDWAGCMSCC